jgi:hypothetical protein
MRDESRGMSGGIRCVILCVALSNDAQAGQKMVGGPQALIKLLQSGRAEMKKDGFDFRSVDTGRPKQFVSAGAELLGIVPTTLTMQAPDGKLLQKSYLVAVSPDDGRSWWFIDGAGLDPDKVKKVIPKFPAKLRLPEKEAPRLVRGGG